MPCHPASLPYPAFSLSCRGLGSWEEAMTIGWHRGDTPGLPTEPWNGGLGDVPPWWGVQGELEGFLGFPELGAWWFSAPSFWSSVVSAFGSPLVLSSDVVWLQFSPSSDLGGCPFSVPLNSVIGVVHPWFPPVQSSEFVCFQFAPSLELTGCPLSVLPKFRS